MSANQAMMVIAQMKHYHGDDEAGIFLHPLQQQQHQGKSKVLLIRARENLLNRVNRFKNKRRVGIVTCKSSSYPLIIFDNYRIQQEEDSVSSLLEDTHSDTSRSSNSSIITSRNQELAFISEQGKQMMMRVHNRKKERVFLLHN